MPLPSELLSHTASFLPKSSLKPLRLVCKTLHDITTPLLFDSIFVSARRLDREVVNLVASRFPDSIKTVTVLWEHYPTPTPQTELNHRSCRCASLDSHNKQLKLYWAFYFELGLERKRFYESGAAHAQLCHLLSTLPNLRQIVITDRRRRQDLPWLQEASLRQTTEPLPPSKAHVSLSSRICRALADLPGLRKTMTTRKALTGLRPSHKREEAHARAAQLQANQSLRCNCFDEQPPSVGPLTGLRQAESYLTPQNPWAEVMTALHKSSNTSVVAVSVQPTKPTSYLPFAAIEACDAHILRATNTILPRLTKLDLRLNSLMSNIVDQDLRPSSGILSMASNLKSLTIEFLNNLFPYFYGRTHEGVTSFDVLLSGCQLPQLSTLRLRNLMFREDEISSFLQHTPELRDLSLQGCSIVGHYDLMIPLTRADFGSWERVLDTMKESLPRLEQIYIYDKKLYEAVHKHHRRCIAMDCDEMIHRFMFSEGINPFTGIVGERVDDIYDHYGLCSMIGFAN